MPVKRTKITLVTHERLHIRHPSNSTGGMTCGWCESCAALITQVTPDEAARLTGTGVRAVFRRLEAAQLHFSETAAGDVLICLPSLLAG